MNSIIKLMMIVLLVVFLFIFLTSVNSLKYYKNSIELVKKSRPYSRVNLNAKLSILVLGDSTAVGTGSDNVKLSTAGRLGELYPEAEVVNLAQNGLRLRGLIAILETLKQEKQFDIAIIQIGANDIIRFTPINSIEGYIEEVLERTKKLSKKVIVLHSGNIGETRFFPWYLRSILAYRSFKVREVYMRVASSHDSQYVDLINSPVSKLLRDNPGYYYSSDYLHLNDNGYGLWFDEIRKKL